MTKQQLSYIDHECRHYFDYCRVIETIGEKADRLWDVTKTMPFEAFSISTMALWNMELLVRSVDQSLNELGEDHRAFFDAYYVKGRTNLIELAQEFFVCTETLRRRRRAITELIGSKMGIIKYLPPTRKH